MLRDDLIQDLIDMNMPEEVANQLLSNDSLRWEGELDESEIFIGLDILD